MGCDIPPLRAIKEETRASQARPRFRRSSVAQKHLIVAGAAAAGSSRAVCGIGAGGERNLGVVIEAATGDSSEGVAAGLANGNLAGVALPDRNLLILRRDGPSRLGAVRSVGER